MRVGVIFKAVMPVLGVRFFGGDFFEPLFEVLMQTGFVVVDKYACCDVHRVAEQQSFADAAFFQAIYYHWRDVEIGSACRNIERQFFSIGFHIYGLFNLDARKGKRFFFSILHLLFEIPQLQKHWSRGYR
jgi:hypothetical protein